VKFLQAGFFFSGGEKNRIGSRRLPGSERERSQSCGAGRGGAAIWWLINSAGTSAKAAGQSIFSKRGGPIATCGRKEVLKRLFHTGERQAGLGDYRAGAKKDPETQEGSGIQAGV